MPYHMPYNVNPEMQLGLGFSAISLVRLDFRVRDSGKTGLHGLAGGL